MQKKEGIKQLGKRKNRCENTFHNGYELFLNDSVNRAAFNASATACTLISVNYVDIAFRNSVARAVGLARAASDASISNLKSHDKPP